VCIRLQRSKVYFKTLYQIEVTLLKFNKASLLEKKIDSVDH